MTALLVYWWLIVRPSCHEVFRGKILFPICYHESSKDRFWREKDTVMIVTWSCSSLSGVVTSFILASSAGSKSSQPSKFGQGHLSLIFSSSLLDLSRIFQQNVTVSLLGKVNLAHETFWVADFFMWSGVVSIWITRSWEKDFLRLGYLHAGMVEKDNIR